MKILKILEMLPLFRVKLLFLERRLTILNYLDIFGIQVKKKEICRSR